MNSPLTRGTASALGVGAVILFGITFYPVLVTLIAKWAHSDEYSHAFLTIPIIFFMVWQKRTDLGACDGKFSTAGLLLLPVICFLYYFSLLTEVDTLLALSMYAALVSILLSTLGVRSLTILATPLLLLLLLIPVPEQLYITLTFPLQIKVSEASEWIIRLFDIPLLRQGNVMHTPEKSFEVVEACSGLRSIVTLLTLSVIMGYFLLTTYTTKALLLLASVPAAIIVNIFRVTGMIVIFHYFNIDLTHGALHTATGLVVFLLALLFLFFFQRVLESWEKP